MAKAKPNSPQMVGGALLVIGLVFSVVGASGDTTFLWIGIPFLIGGLAGVWKSLHRNNR